MPLSFVMIGMYVGAICAIFWLALGGSAVTALLLYAVCGNVAVCIMLAPALRSAFSPRRQTRLNR